MARQTAHEKIPSDAVIFVLLIALVAPFFGRSALGWIVDMSVIGASIGYGYTSLAAYQYAKKEKNSWILVTGIIGSIMAVIFIVLLLVPIPILDCSLGKESYNCLGIRIALGIIFYIKSNRKQEEAK